MYDEFCIGKKVEVTNKDLQSYGLVGTIEGFYSAYTVYVRFDDWNGLGSKCLTIAINNLKIKGENNTMAVTGNYRVAMVKFISGSNTTKEYAFALFDDDVYANDFVLCDTSYGYQVARVVNIIYNKEEYDGCVITKEIICKINFNDYNHRKEVRKQKESLKKQMDKMVKDNQELILYQAIAEKNPDMAALLETYKSLGDV